MKCIVILCSLLGLVLLSCGANAADCDEVKNPDDSDFKNFFKNLGCKVSNGAEQVVEAAKPYANKIGDTAKDIGSSVAEQYDALKHRIISDDHTSSAPVPYDAPTERVPLAPITPALPAEITKPQPIGEYTCICIHKYKNSIQSDIINYFQFISQRVKSIIDHIQGYLRRHQS